MTFSTQLRSALALLCGTALAVGAQATQAAHFIDVGSEREHVLRILQLVGDVPLYPWSIREFDPAEADRLRPTNAARAALLPPDSKAIARGRFSFDLLPIGAGVVYNSAFPYGFNDGPIWAGRGLTSSVSAGVAGRFGPLSFQLEPLAFIAENRPFQLVPNDTVNKYLDGLNGGSIDLPQQFGAKAYRQFDWGQSSVRLDAGPIAVEVSTADQWWGPAVENPLILGNNAAGFPHLTLGTSRPVNIGVGHIHARLVWGRLGQSDYSPEVGADSIRFMSGLAAVFVPRGVPGLEVGVTRFFHSRWPDGGFFRGSFSQPLEGILKSSLATATNTTGESPDNQLGSAFARWAFPGSGFEMYGEYGREDHNIDIRDLEQEPDHDAAYTVGFQRAWRRTARVVVLRAELVNSRLSPLQAGRGQTPWYLHDATVTQGHTVLGQLLGSPAVYGGSGSTLAVDAYSASGRWTVRYDRIGRAEERTGAGFAVPSADDVLHSLGLARVQNTRAASFTLDLRSVWDLNRNFAGDRFNLNLSAGVSRLW